MKYITKIIEILLVLAVLICVGIKLFSYLDGSSKEKKVGIIVPLEHAAMDAIVAGFTDTLNKEYSSPIDYKVANAQNDPTLERALIQQMKSEKYDLIVPIGVDATEMTLAYVQQIPIVSLASSMSAKERKQLKTCNIALVHDEVSVNKILQFFHQVYPDITHIVLVHSAANKVFPEVKLTVAEAKKLNIEITPKMVSNLSDLYSVANNLPANTQGILILKDSLIASGIATLVKTAIKLQIPLVSSDEGSVQNGAGFALSVHEKEIGVEGAHLASSILTGRPPCELPMIDMHFFTVFINKKTLRDTNQDFQKIEKAAGKLHYQIESLVK